jgi:hypothetical protein
MAEKNIRFACPHCGQSGEVIWEGDGAIRELIRLSNGFHVEEGRLPGARHVIICDSCDEIDPAGLVKPGPT